MTVKGWQLKIANLKLKDDLEILLNGSKEVIIQTDNLMKPLSTGVQSESE